MYKTVSSCPLFCGMNESEIDSSLALLSSNRKSYKKGENLINAGTRMYSFGLVLSGSVQVSFSDIDGNSVLMAGVSVGDTFGESLCWLGVREVPVTVTAVTDCSVLWLSPLALSENSDCSPLLSELRNRFVSMLARKTLAMNDRIQVLSKPTLRQKIVTYLSQCSLREGSKTFSVPFDRDSLALYLGVNRSALSRELSRMQKEGIIEFYKNSFRVL